MGSNVVSIGSSSKLIKKHELVMAVTRELPGMDEIRALNNSLTGYDLMTELEEGKLYPVNVTKYAEQCGLDISHAYDELKTILDKFLNTIHEIPLGGKRIFKASLIAGYTKDDATYTLKVQWNTLLIPYLSGNLDKGTFTMIDQRMSGISSSKRYKLYEFLQNNLYKKAFTITYQEVRDILQIQEHEYPIFGDLNKRLIQPTLSDMWEQLRVKVVTKCGSGRITFIDTRFRNSAKVRKYLV